MVEGSGKAQARREAVHCGLHRGDKCWCLHCFETMDVGAVLDARGDECITPDCDGFGWGRDLMRLDDPTRLQYYDKDGQLISGS